MKSIELVESQKAYYVELNTLIHKLNTEMAISVDATNGEEVAHSLTRRIENQQHNSRIMELATLIYDHCKGLAFEMANTDDKVLNAKSDLQRKWFDGVLAKWSALYAKAEHTVKANDKGIEGLRSILSREKELIRTNIHK